MDFLIVCLSVTLSDYRPDFRALTAKVISTASAVLHAPVQMCFGALYCVGVTSLKYK